MIGTGNARVARVGALRDRRPALSNRDVWVVVGFGVVGSGLERARVPLGPFVIGFVLAPMFESQLRAALQMSSDGVAGILNGRSP